MMSFLPGALASWNTFIGHFTSIPSLGLSPLRSHKRRYKFGQLTRITSNHIKIAGNEETKEMEIDIRNFLSYLLNANNVRV